MNQPNFPTDIPCQCYPGRVHECVCPEEEKALRAYSCRYLYLPLMTQKQRAWCLAEIDMVEGYNRMEYESVSDATLAATVLNAWTDYARDKGLL